MATYSDYFTDPAIEPILTRLGSELDPSLSFHSIYHTLDVIQQSLTLADLDQLNTVDKLLLAIAAAFHDAGFLSQRTNNEPIGAEMAAMAMHTDQRFTEEQKVEVCRAILDTAINPDGPVQIATGRLSPWLLDADLANLGRDDFFEKTSLLAQELNLPIERVMETAAKIMDRHTWLSPAAQGNLMEKKRENRQALEQKLHLFSS